MWGALADRSLEAMLLGPARYGLQVRSMCDKSRGPMLGVVGKSFPKKQVEPVQALSTWLSQEEARATLMFEMCGWTSGQCPSGIQSWQGKSLMPPCLAYGFPIAIQHHLMVKAFVYSASYKRVFGGLGAGHTGIPIIYPILTDRLHFHSGTIPHQRSDLFHLLKLVGGIFWVQLW